MGSMQRPARPSTTTMSVLQVTCSSIFYACSHGQIAESVCQRAASGVIYDSRQSRVPESPWSPGEQSLVDW